MTESRSPFAPGRIGSLTLRNRIVKLATFEAMAREGMPLPALVEHHRVIAAGGAAMTTVAYAAVSRDGLSYGTQLWMRPESTRALRDLTDAVHSEGGAASMQIGHAGGFSDPAVTRCPAFAPSRRFETYRMSWSREMGEAEIHRVRSDFVSSARLVRDAGFDALEIHAGHGYLLSQFLSPFTNHRSDRWGGSEKARLEFPRVVVRDVRKALGPDFPILVKMNVADGFRGGLDVDGAVNVARMFESEGVDALVLSGGFLARTPFFMLRGNVPVREMARNEKNWAKKAGLALFGQFLVPAHPYAPGFFLEDARRIREAVRLPLVLVGGIKSLPTMNTAMEAGFEFVGMARALLYDPTLVRRMEAGDVGASGCEPCNLCVVEMDRGGVRCPVTGGPAGTGP